jgi:hypothetical protein
MDPGLLKNEKEAEMKAGNAFKYNTLAYLPFIYKKKCFDYGPRGHVSST